MWNESETFPKSPRSRSSTRKYQNNLNERRVHLIGSEVPGLQGTGRQGVAYPSHGVTSTAGVALGHRSVPLIGINHEWYSHLNFSNNGLWLADGRLPIADTAEMGNLDGPKE
jgi:hypothetical protein